jgi:pyrroline-5-carboxylate reductase
MSQSTSKKVAILGGGNLGQALARGWGGSAYFTPGDIHVTRRNAGQLSEFEDAGFRVSSDNPKAVEQCELILIAVQPQQLDELLEDVVAALDPNRHRVISLVSGVDVARLRQALGFAIPIVRAMPNTAVSIGESMTCLAADDASALALAEATELFGLVGETLVIDEEMMVPATALCACGIAFFLRAVRAASQGGIEIGFHPDEAIALAAQTARGAASLVLKNVDAHPEAEIDRVTTPRGCTIAGLNEMEHQGFSSAMIKGILLSARKAGGLYTD